MRERRDVHAAFLASGLAHLVMILSLSRLPAPGRPTIETAPAPGSVPEVRGRVFLPPAEVIRALPTPPPATRQTPEPAPGRDRVSIGGPSALRQTTPLELQRDRDLTREVARGTAHPGPAARPEGAPAEGVPEPAPATTSMAAPRELAQGLGRATTEAGDRPAGPLPGPPRPQGIGESLRRLDERLSRGSGTPGTPTGTGQQLGPFLFDPQGADFTAWVNHGKNEIYRNWILPQSALFGITRGHVDIVVRIGRDGALAELAVVRSSGTPALDRAAVNALRASRFLPLPSDYRPADVTFEISFFYGEARPS